jgi:uncharacterized membrane protein
MFLTEQIMQWMLYFYIYCFLGWIFESCYVSLKERRWTNRGFLRGPFLPIYGSGAVMMLVVSEPFRDNLVLTYFAGVVGATVLEYVTGAALEAIFKVRYWDYSYQKFNIKGYICLSSSIAWGFFTIGMNEYLHPAILKLLEPIPVAVQVLLTGGVSIYFVVDTIMSVKDALDLRDVLLKIEEAREDMERLQKRMEVALAFADEQMEEFLESHPQFMKLEERRKALREYRQALKEHLIELRDKSEQKVLELTEIQRKELEETLDAAERWEERRQRIREVRAKRHRRGVWGNPTMRAPKHQEALETLREILARK